MNTAVKVDQAAAARIVALAMAVMEVSDRGDRHADEAVLAETEEAKVAATVLVDATCAEFDQAIAALLAECRAAVAGPDGIHS